MKTHHLSAWEQEEYVLNQGRNSRVRRCFATLRMRRMPGRSGAAGAWRGRFP